MDIHLFQSHLLKRLSSPHWIILGVQSKFQSSINLSPLLKCKLSGSWQVNTSQTCVSLANYSNYCFPVTLSLVLCSFTHNVYRSLSWKFLWEESWINLRALVCFPSLRNHTCCLLCPMFVNTCFIHFVQVSSRLQENNSYNKFSEYRSFYSYIVQCTGNSQSLQKD